MTEHQVLACWWLLHHSTLDLLANCHLRRDALLSSMYCKSSQWRVEYIDNNDNEICARDNVITFGCFTNVFVDSACKQLTVASSQAPNLFRPNNSSGSLMLVWIILCLSLNKSPSRALFTYGGWGQLPFTYHAWRWTECWVTKFSLSVLIWCYYTKYFRHHFLIIIIIKRKEKPTSWWHTRNTRYTKRK